MNDDRKAEIARFHPKSHGILDKTAHGAYLEIKPEGLSIVDDILITFIWVEKQRIKKKRRRRIQ